MMLAACVVAARKKQRALFVLTVLTTLTYSITGNQWVGNQVMNWLERDYVGIQPLDQEPFDVVIVLGGCTNLRPGGTPQLTGAGDRVMLAARLYHAQLTPQIVCTGGKPGRNAAEQAQRLLMNVGVKGTNLMQIGGHNTKQELEAISGLVKQHDWKRIGLITSAWHLRRAMQNAARQELSLIPLPANFRGSLAPWSWTDLVPSAGGFSDSHYAMKEILGSAVGR